MCSTSKRERERGEGKIKVIKDVELPQVCAGFIFSLHTHTYPSQCSVDSSPHIMNNGEEAKNTRNKTLLQHAFIKIHF